MIANFPLMIITSASASLHPSHNRQGIHSAKASSSTTRSKRDPESTALWPLSVSEIWHQSSANFCCTSFTPKTQANDRRLGLCVTAVAPFPCAKATRTPETVLRGKTQRQRKCSGWGTRAKGGEEVAVPSVIPGWLAVVLRPHS